MKKIGYRHTIAACLIAGITQAIIVNFAPLLFVTFRESFGLSAYEVTALITVNFVVQLLTDLFASKFAPKLGVKNCLVAAHIFCASGLVFLPLLPRLISPLVGLSVATVVYAVGGGLIEVLTSPTVEACPTKNKERMMSVLHSFYCWGVAFVVLASTLFFALVGIDKWEVLALLWAIIPAANAVYFCFVPVNTMDTEESEKKGGLSLFKNGVFLLLFLMMICAGAAEQAVAQWVSSITETGLQVDKTTGDLIGTCGFAVTMGVARALHGKYAEKLPIKIALIATSALCVVGYLLIGLSSVPVVGLIGCAACGLACGIFWPGTLSLAARTIPTGGTAMFALLALAGDIGCTSGPTLVGLASGGLQGLQSGILLALIFPVCLIVFTVLLRKNKSK